MHSFTVDGVSRIVEYSEEEGGGFSHSWSSSFSWSFFKASLLPNGNDVIGELDDAGNGYLVSAVYSTGDSFGWASDAEVEYLIVLPTKEEANSFCDWAEETSSKQMKKSGSMVKEYTANSGEVYKIHFPWSAPFELLSYINLTKVSLKN